jgi:hypothetical protein
MESLLQLIEGPAGAFVMAISGLLWLVMLLIAFPFLGFRKAWWWGLTCLFLPGIGTLVFSLSYFRETWKYLAITTVSLVLCWGIFLLRAFLATFFVEPYV